MAENHLGQANSIRTQKGLVVWIYLQGPSNTLLLIEKTIISGEQAFNRSDDQWRKDFGTFLHLKL